MAVLIATASCTAYRAALESSGEVVSERALVRRVGWLAALAQTMAAQVVTERWTGAALTELASGKSGDGRVLPAKGWMAVRRLGWGCSAPTGVYVPERVRRIAEEEAARALRLALHRRAVLTAVCATWPVDPGRRSEAEWRALRAVLPAGTSAAEIRNRTRQVRAHLAEHGLLPADVTGVEGSPVVAAQVLLAAADKQLLTLTRAGAAGLAGGEPGTAVPVGPDTAVLRVKLPLVAAPASRADWAWHVITFTVPPHVPVHAEWCAPTLRVAAHRLRVDLPFTVAVPAVLAVGHRVGLGLDWGVNTLLTGTVARLTDDQTEGQGSGPGTGPVGGRVVSDGRMLRYDATAISAKLHRLRGHREHLATKRDHYAALLPGLSAPHPQWAALQDWQARAAIEHERICAKIRRLNRALAWSAARWAVDQAIATNCSAICLEDLATLQAHGHRKGNARLSGQVRGLVVDAIRHLAAKAGIAVVTVPARGTSKYCPRCGTGTSVLQHVAAPDRPTRAGWKWARCSCGLSADRDWAAAERIVARGLLGQSHTRTDRATGHRTITTVVEGNVSRARRSRAEIRRVRRANRTGRDTFTRPDRPGPTPGKGRPTPKRPGRPPRAARGVRDEAGLAQAFRRVPEWRTVPAPTVVGQRPAGHEPQSGHLAVVRSGRARDFQHRTGFQRTRATPVIRLSADYGPRARTATPARPV
ncbi:zinc ribbon domain-containing protein [Streptosporangium subroseum]|uniref:zinc ribbon domain-containing protein n=1 Tax=Streptosporangium subroseum TaxID=106412 RepID=UPI003087B26A|nr:transposase [Streptosporangium subroseum]